MNDHFNLIHLVCHVQSFKEFQTYFGHFKCQMFTTPMLMENAVVSVYLNFYRNFCAYITIVRVFYKLPRYPQKGLLKNVNNNTYENRSCFYYYM